MIFVGDLVKALKDNITIVIDLGPDENSYSHQVIYHSQEHDHLTVDTIYLADEKSIGIEVL